MTKRVVENFDVEFDEASTIEEAIEVLHDSYRGTRQDKYEVIFLDHALVDHDGSSIVVNSLRTASSPHIPIVLTSTGMLNGEPIVDLQQLKVDLYVSAVLLKPLSFDEVREEFQKLGLLTLGGTISPAPPAGRSEPREASGLRKYRSTYTEQEALKSDTNSDGIQSSLQRRETFYSDGDGDVVCENNSAFKRILVIEDSEAYSKVLVKHVQSLGFEYVTCNVRQNAINVLQKDTSFCVILINLSMSRLDGISTIDYVRNTMHLKIPIVFMIKPEMLSHWPESKNEDEDLNSFALRHNVDLALKKPVTMEVLSEALESLNIQPSNEQFRNKLIAVEETGSPDLRSDAKETTLTAENADLKYVNMSDDEKIEMSVRRRSRSSFGSEDELYTKIQEIEQEEVASSISEKSLAESKPLECQEGTLGSKKSAEDLHELVRSSSTKSQKINKPIKCEENEVKTTSDGQRRSRATSFHAGDEYDPTSGNF